MIIGSVDANTGGYRPIPNITIAVKHWFGSWPCDTSLQHLQCQKIRLVPELMYLWAWCEYWNFSKCDTVLCIGIGCLLLCVVDNVKYATYLYHRKLKESSCPFYAYFYLLDYESCFVYAEKLTSWRKTVLSLNCFSTRLWPIWRWICLLLISVV